MIVLAREQSLLVDQIIYYRLQTYDLLRIIPELLKANSLGITTNNRYFIQFSSLKGASKVEPVDVSCLNRLDLKTKTESLQLTLNRLMTTTFINTIRRFNGGPFHHHS